MGTKVLTALLVATLFLLAFAESVAPIGIAAIFLAWGAMIFIDATVRGKSVFDIRVATIALFLGAGVLVMAIVGLVN